MMSEFIIPNWQDVAERWEKAYIESTNQIKELETQLDKILRQNERLFTQKGKDLREAEATIARVKPLVEKWLGEQKQYPLGPVGSHAAAAVKLCANELKALLKQEQEDG